MAITNGYATLAELQDYIGDSSADIETMLENRIETASRQIDHYCGRRFWLDSEDDTRLYSPLWPDLLTVDDVTSITSVKTDEDGDGTFEITWTVDTDYVAEPLNAATETPVQPWRRLRAHPYGNYTFPHRLPRSVQIVGTFGWPAVPFEVHNATLLLAHRLHQRRAAPFGVSGAPEFGVLRLLAKLDADGEVLLRPYRRLSGVSGVRV